MLSQAGVGGAREKEEAKARPASRGGPGSGGREVGIADGP